MVDNREVELLNSVMNSKNNFANIQSNENYLELHEATMNYINYINSSEDKTSAEKLTCIKYIFDRSKTLIIVPVEHDIIVVKNNPNFITIILDKGIIRIWNWISIRTYTNQFTVFRKLSLKSLTDVFFSK